MSVLQSYASRQKTNKKLSSRVFESGGDSKCELWVLCFALAHLVAQGHRRAAPGLHLELD